MQETVFLESEFFLLVLFSLVIPAAIYFLLYRLDSISRQAVVLFALCLLAVSGADVVLLQQLREIALRSHSVLDDRLFVGELRLALYLLPVAFAGTGVNLLSHVLIQHLTRAERRFDRKRAVGLRRKRTPGQGRKGPTPEDAAAKALTPRAS